MKKNWLLWAICLFCISPIFSQKENTVFGKSGWRISGVWAGPAVGVGQLNGDPLVFRGGFGGVEFGKRLFLGWGGYETDNDVYIDALDNDQFQMDYSGFLLGFTPAAHKTVHPHLMVFSGTGNAVFGESENDNIFLVQPTLGLEMNVFRFFHLTLDGGYRFVTNVNIPEMTGRDLSGPYVELKMKFGFSW
ncbi:MAG: hypothetical protein AAF960_18815 [Bacteroidota bacterium]